MASNILKSKKTVNGYTINLLKVGDMYIVQSLHDKKRGYSVRYAGASLTKANEKYNK